MFKAFCVYVFKEHPINNQSSWENYKSCLSNSNHIRWVKVKSSKNPFNDISIDTSSKYNILSHWSFVGDYNILHLSLKPLPFNHLKSTLILIILIYISKAWCVNIFTKAGASHFQSTSDLFWSFWDAHWDFQTNLQYKMK